MSFLYGAAEGADITVGTTTVTGGTAARVLYDNAGVLGEYTVSGSGSVAMTASPTLTGTPLAPTAAGGTSTTQIATTAFVATSFLPLSGGTLTGGLTVALGTITADQQNESGTATWNNAGVTFTARKINITDTASNAASLLDDLQVAGSSKWKVDKTGNVTAAGSVTATSLALGASTASNSGFTVGQSTGAFTVPPGGFFVFTGRGNMFASADGVWGMTNNAGTGFSRLAFGDVTSSFPAIKRNGTALNFRLGDDSADAAITAAGGTFSGVVFNAASTTNYLGTTTSAADTMVATPSPALTAYTAGAIYIVKSGFTNATTTPTINISGLGAKTIVKRAATALAAGDYVANMIMILAYDGTNMELLNPVVN